MPAAVEQTLRTAAAGNLEIVQGVPDKEKSLCGKRARPDEVGGELALLAA